MGKFMRPFISYPIGKNRKILVSKTYDGKISVAQQVTIEEDDGKKTDLIIKNSFLFKREHFEEFVQLLTELDLDQDCEE